MWTYYKQVYPNGIWLLFREDEHHIEETFHRQDGWQQTDELSLRRIDGQIDGSDIITEQEAEELLRSLSSQARKSTA